MTRFFQSLLIALFMLLAQHGVVLHAISHVDALSAQSEDSKHHSKHHTAATACDECLGFTHLAFVSPTTVPALGILTLLGHHGVAAPLATPPRLLALLPRSRGPPAYL